jgi:hypothetical protein
MGTFVGLVESNAYGKVDLALENMVSCVADYKMCLLFKCAECAWYHSGWRSRISVVSINKETCEASCALGCQLPID